MALWAATCCVPEALRSPGIAHRNYPPRPSAIAVAGSDNRRCNGDPTGADRPRRHVLLASAGTDAGPGRGSVGLMLLIQALIIVRFGAPRPSRRISCHQGFTVAGTVMSYGPLILAGIVIVMAVATYVYFTQTKQGIATRAGAENERALIFAGYSPSRSAAIAWMVAATTGGLPPSWRLQRQAWIQPPMSSSSFLFSRLR